MANRYAVLRRPAVARAARPAVKVDWSVRLVAMREQMGLTQREFAALVGVSSKTLENWEQGRRSPTGPAGVLLTVLLREPEAVLRAVR